VVSVQIWYRVGSIHETEGQKGMAHLFEHMMFRGSEHFGPEEHARLIREAGGQCNAYTTDEYTVYWDRLAADQLELALSLEADRMGSLRLIQDTLDRERNVVQEEYHLRVKNDPLGSMEKRIRAILYPHHPYEFGPIGRLEDIAQFSVEDCRSFYETYYAPNNAVLSIVGDVKQDEVLQLVESKFGSIPSAPAPKPPQLGFDPSQVKALTPSVTEIPIPVTACAFYTRGVRDQDSAALQLIFQSLASGRSSRLWKKLVKERRLAEFFAGIHLYGQDNAVMIFGGVHLPFMSGKIKTEILRQLDTIKEQGLTPEEFVKVKNQAVSRLIFEQYSANGLATRMAQAEVVNGDYQHMHQILPEIERVTQADIMRVANAYFVEQNLKVVYFKPQEGMFLAGVLGLFKSILM
jgi:zinc protease